MKIDLRSDTVTQPTPDMLRAMMHAQTGDDVYGEDPTVNELQETAAAMFGMEAGLFCPSGTMTNQIAIKVHTQPGDELICSDNAHVYKYEGGGIAFNSGVQAKLLHGHRGLISAQQIEEAINADDIHFPATRLVCLENTTNRGGGSVYSLDEIKHISRLCKDKGLILHLDGARVFNAIAEAGYSAHEIGSQFHSISICLSKSLGCPVGSVLLGSRHFINRAIRIRKIFGGGMRQAGYLAAAGIYALQNNLHRLKQDHIHARVVAATLSQMPAVADVMPVETNIIIFRLQSPDVAERLLMHLKAHNILCGRVAPDSLRMVFHLDIKEEMVAVLTDVLGKFD